MKALTVQQPWAWAIVAGHKLIENRGQRTHHRGRIAVHAARRYDLGAVEWIGDKTGIAVPEDLVRGAVIGEVSIVDCIAEGEASPPMDMQGDPWGVCFPGFKWILADPVAYENPVLAKGQLGLWRWDHAKMQEQQTTKGEAV